MKKAFFTGILLFFGAFLSFAQANFRRGEELFMQNKPREALVYLENSIAEDPAHVQAFLYLGLVYEQLNRTDEAIAAYRKILPRARELTPYVAANLGNVYFHKGNTEYAEQFYTEALNADPVYASAYLGRANTRVKTGSLKEAIVDYELYLSLEPRSSRRGNIERLIALIREEFAAEERRKLLAEEAEREEAERQQRLLAERQRLLDEVSASLQSSAEDSQGLSTGVEDVEGYEGEFELE
jgi:tetratricopeptide (TPR) repeat protein